MNSIMKKYVWLTFVLFFGTQQLLADDHLKQIAQIAQKAYSEGQYRYAIELYDSIISKGYASAALYYNIGNAHFKSEQMAYAIWYYEKAKKLAPGDEQIIHNLNLANTLITDNIEKIPMLFYERWWVNLYSMTTADNWGKIAIVLAFLMVSFFAAYLLSRVIRYKKIFFLMSFAALALFILSLTCAHKQYHNTYVKETAVVFAPRVTAKSAPDAGSIDLFVIHEGTKVWVKEILGDWYEIRLANGNVGWINKNSVRII